MKENNISEDILLLNDFIEGNFQKDKLENYKGSYKMGYFYYKSIQQAIKNILTDYKRILKENEELLEVKVSASAHNRILELEKENEELKEYKRKNEQNSLEYDVDGDWAELKRILNESRKTNEYITYKGEKWIKEKYCIPIQKLKDIIEKISLYKKLAKESIEQGIVIADNDSLEYGRMQAHNVDVSMLQELLESEE